MDQKFFYLNGESVYCPSRLLIPDFLLAEFNRRITQFGSMKALFHFVVSNKHRVYKKKSMSRDGKICYQPAGMKLHRKDFFPNNEDWEKFRSYAFLQRISITFLFVLILNDWDGFESEKFEVPSIPEKIQLFTSIEISEIQTYIYIKHLLL